MPGANLLSKPGAVEEEAGSLSASIAAGHADKLILNFKYLFEVKRLGSTALFC